MYERLIALKDWCERADTRVFWLGLIIGVSLAIIAPAALQPDRAVVPVAEPQSFDDVPFGYWAYDEIELIHSYSVTLGCSYDPPLYCPDLAPTRAEMAVFAARILEVIEKKCE